MVALSLLLNVESRLASNLGQTEKGQAHKNPEGKKISQPETHWGRNPYSLTPGRRSVNCEDYTRSHNKDPQSSIPFMLLVSMAGPD